jgi:hypothetical protein
MEALEKVSGPISEKPVRDAIMSLESELAKQPQIDIPVIHRHSGGIYAREITIPKGALLTGRIYHEDHFDIMVSGDITVSSDDGVKRLTGFNLFEGKAGKKRAGYANEDTRWITFHKCPEMLSDDYINYTSSLTFEKSDLRSLGYVKEEEIRKAFPGGDYDQFKKGYLAAKKKPAKIDIDQEDYKLMLKEYGFTEELVREQTENTEDQIEVDHPGVSVKDSYIQGKGLFADKSFKPGDVIMPGRIGSMRTIAGRYTNHAIDPNAKMLKNGQNIDLVAIMTIDKEEITVDYRICLDLRGSE